MRLAARDEIFVRLKKQAYSRKGFIKGFHRNRICTFRGVAQHSLISAEAVKHYEMIEIPMDDAWEFALLAKHFGFIAISLCRKPVAAGGAQDISCI